MGAQFELGIDRVQACTR